MIVMFTVRNEVAKVIYVFTGVCLCTGGGGVPSPGGVRVSGGA